MNDRARLRRDDPAEVIDLLGDGCARAVLIAANGQPVTAKEIIRRCDASETTVYRRIRTLVERGLLEERIALLRDSKQATVYRTTFTRLEVLFDGKRFAVAKHADEAARIAHLFSELPFETVSVDVPEGQVTARATFDDGLMDRLGALLASD